jgi:recombination protein RecA
MYGEGISRESNVLDVAVNMDIVEKAGAWFSYSGNRIGQGRENVKQYLKDNPEICNEIESKIRSKLLENANPSDISDDFEDEDFED